ncbi:MAG TPA: DNA-binding response regulator [Lachnospiraceae bacterium]|nr:DNA-binding response regulator [Lachnospiraceae bacterium]
MNLLRKRSGMEICMKNVMIVEDQKMIQSILKGYIEKADDFLLVASIEGAEEACEICGMKKIHLILMDVQTAHRENGLTAVKKIKETYPDIKIVVVTSLVDGGILEQAKCFGADSLWYKDTDEGTLMQIVQRTLAGEHVFPDAPPVVEIGTAKSTEFTKTEMRVLRCLVKGLPYPKIAEKLSMEVVTVKYHVTNMLRKTNLKNKLQLAVAVSDAKFVVDLDEDEVD